ncbi:hypothetical protein HBI56_002380 [Parastagonospora nodorum]|uniref:SET domain-containing protein n=1 Tax=Phaeosphaeria nodorum (strain SN15 / ATCC MYA-4574 / FGSC 10173) TaxID=321614 RepID=A0A7U2HX69_PHANO|nr:hypothetical protein HBH56_138670 [Parastagonospora nodorum]QRC91422.1 hypothetical protein JI435_009280 [Parastagonospora nodorum SN15]KAH3928020.1 hypothetical protein HBH54_143810 [Parastagonospora nodorum]KAH3972371.1 hypothetical protein HBH52_151410 [Parastagonospora nodorum]KAH3983388.1 hypothetical protein HBH51_034320 [Parastagonospora nodorum]
MANTQGGSGKNPYCINDSEPPRWFSKPSIPFSTPTNTASIAGYVDFIDEDNPTERHIDEVPAGSRAADQRRPKRGRRSDLENGNPAAERRKSDWMTSDPDRDVIDLTFSDDEGGVRGRRHASRSETNNVSSPAKAGPSSTIEVSKTRPAERVKLSEPITPSFSLLHFAAANSRTSSHSPIGGRADPEREQTTPRRVNADATSTARREKDVGQPGTSGTPTRLPEGTQRIRDPNVSRILTKARAIKSATSPPTRRTGFGQLTGTDRPASDHAYSSSSAIVSKHISGRQASFAKRGPGSELSNKPDTETNPKNGNIGQSKVARSLPLDVLHENSLGEDTDMGAQVSEPGDLLASVSSPTELENPQPGIRTSPLPTCLSSSEVVEAQVDDMAQLPPLENIDTNQLVSPIPTQADLTKDIESARRRFETSLSHRLNERYEDHAYLVKNIMWRQRTCYERELRLKRSNDSSQRPQRHTMTRPACIQSISPFINMTDTQSPFDKGNHKASLNVVSQDVFTKSHPKGVIRSSWSVKAITFAPEALQIPSFMEYVSLRTNVLADNESKLLTMPWLGDDEPEKRQKALKDDLPHKYEIKFDKNPYFDLRNEQYNFYFGAVSSLLDDLGLSWDVMLYYLLSPETSLTRINRSSDRYEDYETLMQDRTAYEEETFQRDDSEQQVILIERAPDSWHKLLPQLREPSPMQLRMAALICAAILANCNFSPWYLAKQSTTMREYIDAKTKRAEAAPKSEFRSIVCSVCHEHNCLFHGQIRENPESGTDSETPEEDASENPEDDPEDDPEEELMPIHFDSDDSDVEKIVNYKFPSNPDSLKSQPTSKALGRSLPPPGDFRPKWWLDYTITSQWDERKPFVPCNHEGTCAEARCRCFMENVTCEKTCRCPPSCNRRFPGCTCAAIPGKRTCALIKDCLCVKFKRECDADLCGTCGATEILDPVNRYNDELLHHSCANVAIQRGVPKKTLLGKSEVHGFGLYAGEDIDAHELIGEYAGETLSIGEMQRREIIYTYEKNMYLFKLNKEQDVDATHMGNKLRFINNANATHSNCASKVVFCNTVFRVALYALTSIKAGSELFFNYNYPEEMTKNFKQPKGKIVAVKQVVKQPKKGKMKRAPSFNDSITSSTGGNVDKPERPGMREALAKARAAKAAKRALKLAEEGLQTHATSGRPKQARESASGPSSLRMSKNPDVGGRPGRERDSRAREGSNASRSRAGTRAKSGTPILVIQETDDEDEDTNGGAEASDPQVSEDGSQASDTVPERAGAARPRMRKSAPLFAVKEIKKTRGGVRPGAGRKRKRPLIVNSEDE